MSHRAATLVPIGHESLTNTLSLPYLVSCRELRT
jgi:hypothetical protein